MNNLEGLLEGRDAAEQAFLDASIAVWREIDKHDDGEGHYVAGVPESLARDAELRRVEREAWHRYRETLSGSAGSSEAEVRGWTPAPTKAYVVFSYGDPMPITACFTAELAEQYAAALGRLPKHHPLYTENACVDELPLLSELPQPLRDPENQEWDESIYSEGRPQTYGA